MLEVADFVLVMAYPDGVTNPSAGIILMLPRLAEGPASIQTGPCLGMRATRSDSLILDLDHVGPLTRGCVSFRAG